MMYENPQVACSKEASNKCLDIPRLTDFQNQLSEEIAELFYYKNAIQERILLIADVRSPENGCNPQPEIIINNFSDYTLQKMRELAHIRRDFQSILEQLSKIIG